MVGSDVMRGYNDFMILFLLLDEDSYGYEISRQINKSVRTVKNYMAEMQEKGIIERKNGKKNGEWIVNE